MYLYATNDKNPRTGYGRMELGLLQGFQALGIEVTEVSAERPASGGVTLIIGHPEWALEAAVRNTRRWLYTMSETMRVSQDWVTAINAHFERVFVPCPDLVGIYHDSGVHIPVDYVPLGMDYDPPPYIERDPNPETFTFLFYALGDTRKGIDLSLFAFDRLFKGDMRYRAIVKCRDNPRYLTGLKSEQVTLLTGQEESWWQLMARCHAFVFPSRGEGFGFPPREAVLSGLPTIATQWLGMWDVTQWGIPLRVKELQPSEIYYDDANEARALWAEPDADDLDVKMQRVVDDYPLLLKEINQWREYLLHYRWENTCQQIWECV